MSTLKVRGIRHDEAASDAITIASDGAVTISGDMVLNSTGGLQVPTGTTAQRPSSPSEGYIRYNTTSKALEIYALGAWLVVKEFPLGSEANPASSAVAILADNASSADGYYWITIDGTAKQIYCDMTNGGWMYLMPPSDATDTNPFGYTLTTNSGGSVSCYNAASIDTSLNWTMSRTYTCGPTNAYVGQTLAWTKPSSLSYTQLGYAAVTSGNSQSHTVNGSAVSANRTNSLNTFYDTSSYTIGTNSGFLNNTYQSAVISENGHRVISSTGNISIFAQAYSEGNSFGGATYISQLRIK